MMCFSDRDYTEQAHLLGLILVFWGLGSQGLDKSASTDLALHQHSSLLYCSLLLKG